MPTEAGRYRFASWTVASAFAMPELPGSAAEPDWRVVCHAAAPRHRHATWYQRANSTDGRPWVWLGRDAGADVLRFPGRAWCVMPDGSSEIGCAWHRGLGHDMRAQMLVNHILPLAASRHGRLVLHAAVVRQPSGGALAFVGTAGAGKSTLAASLGARGWDILSDDRLIADGERRAFPVAPYVRLAPDAAAHLGLHADLPPGHHKIRVRLGLGGAPARTAEPATLERLVFLRRGAGVTRLEPMAGRESLMEVLGAQLQLGFDRREVRTRMFALVGDLIGNVPCQRLTLAPGLESLASAAVLLEQVPSRSVSR